MRPRSLGLVVAAAVLAVFAASCSSTAKKPAVSVSATTNNSATTNTGLCTLVSPSVVATALSASMTFPTTLRHNSLTECVYRSKAGTGTTVLIRYDTKAGNSVFEKDKEVFQRKGQKLGPITGLGDQAYYFTERSGQASVTTVVVLQGSLELLTTGTATLDQIGSIARFALSQFQATHASVTPSSS